MMPSMTTSTKKTLTWGGLVLLIVWAIPGALLTAYTLSTLWTWFIRPLGGPHLGLGSAYGLTLIWFYLTSNLHPTQDADVSGILSAIVSRLIVSAISLFLGWLTLIFM